MTDTPLTRGIRYKRNKETGELEPVEVVVNDPESYNNQLKFRVVRENPKKKYRYLCESFFTYEEAMARWRELIRTDPQIGDTISVPRTHTRPGARHHVTGGAEVRRNKGGD